MKIKNYSFGIEDLLVIIAILVILTASIVPHFAASHSQTNASKSARPPATAPRPR